ncbi:MAG: bifunctional UDP-N-acetylglucosamine diphosphorylase/glucosamine-1-phosphate N-acetyltransferase GlmU [Bdellovibrionota bacterium]
MLGILLAAGRGTRMKSDMPKVLFTVNDEPMAFAPFQQLLNHCNTVAVVIGYGGSDVKASLLGRASEVNGLQAEEKTLFFTQQELKGTADAVKTALDGLARGGHKQGADEEILVLNGDLPLIRKETLEHFLKQVKAQNVDSACLTFTTQRPTGFGRIVRDMRGIFASIKEEKDATVEEKKIREVNSGVYYFKMAALEKGLSKVSDENSQKEFYLTDALGAQSGLKSAAIRCPFKWDLSGVNTTYELSIARGLAQARLQKSLAEQYGVAFSDPLSTFVSARCQFEGPCTLGPNVQLMGRTKISKNVQVVGSTLIEDSQIGESVFVDFSTVIRSSKVMRGSKIGPFAHLRPDSIVEEEVKVGNFVELKKTRLGKGAKVSHLSYLGDADVGDGTNIGCGTITCNFDGASKHKTSIGKNAFIGSDTQLIAPISIGDEAYVASGTTLTEDVPAGALALARAELTIKNDYARRLLARLKTKK